MGLVRGWVIVIKNKRGRREFGFGSDTLLFSM